MYGAGADPIWQKAESAPGPWTSGAAKLEKDALKAVLWIRNDLFRIRIQL